MKKFITFVILVLLVLFGYLAYRQHKINQAKRIAAMKPTVVLKEKTILIREGLTNKDINQYLLDKKLMADSQFLELSQTKIKDLPTAWQYDFFQDAPRNVDLEGFLFPDTYRLYENDNSQILIDKMLANFDKKLTPELRAEIVKQKKSIFEIITLASIVEKEVRSTADMKLVAGIFYNRLKSGQGLQSCATLAYILGVNKTQYSYADTQIDSPYNTYKYRGLPPGPIANPGLAAITAAIYPTKTDYNYFLSDPATGQTIFSKTLDQHNANKAKYLK